MDNHKEHEAPKNNMVRIGTCQAPEIIGDPLSALSVMLQFATD
jgi:hypothetical protein